jgi:hypothetical protein
MRTLSIVDKCIGSMTPAGKCANMWNVKRVAISSHGSDHDNRRRSVEAAAGRLKIVGREDLVAMKVAAGSRKDLMDTESCIAVAGDRPIGNSTPSVVARAWFAP